MKKKFFAVALATTMVASSAVPAMADTVSTDTETGLIGYYAFDDTLKNAVGEGAAKLHGGAGDTWNEEAKGSAAYAEGKNGKAYSFTGDGATRGEGLELDIQMPAEYTISYWVNPDTVTSATSMVFVPIDLDNGLNIADNWFGATFPTVRIWGTLATEIEGGSYIDNWQEAADSLCGTWTYITLTGNSEGKNVLYINGKSVGEGSSIAGAFKNQYIFLGINFWDVSFDGLMDDVAIYNRALSADDVAALYEKNGVPVKEEDPSEEVTDPSEEVTDPSEEVTDPSEEVTDPSEEVTDPSEEVTDPSEEVTDPSEEVTDPSEEVTDPGNDSNDFDVTDADAANVQKDAVVTGLPENVKPRVASIEKSSANYEAIAKFVAEKLKGKKVAAADLSLMLDGKTYEKQPEGKVKVTLSVFENIKDAKWVQVYRYDETAKDFITVDKAVEVKDGKFTFETDHFTPYLFASVDAPETESTTQEPTTQEPTTTTGKTVTDTSSKPQTGDSAPIAVFAGLAAAGLAVFAVSKKRKNA